MVKWSGLGKAIDQAVTLLKRHQPYHESDHVLSLIYNVATGGTRYQDIELRRQSVSFLEAVGAEKIPAPSTAGDFVRRFDAPDVVDLMEAVNASRLKVWAQQPARFFQRAEIDVDGTMAPTSGECKEGMEISYDGQWGYAPLIVTLANTGEVLYAVNRSGNRPSHEGAAEWLDRSIELVREAGFRKVRLRGDTDFSLTAHFDRWTEAGVEFDFGIDAHPSFVKWAEALPEARWKELGRPSQGKGKGKKRRQRRDKVKPEIVKRRGFKTLTLEREEIAEIDYRPSKAKRTYTLVANWAYLVIAAQAWNLKAWMGLVLPARLQARELVKMEYRRFLREVIEMPCQILRRGRQLVYRLLDVNGWSRLLLEGSKWLKHRPAT